MMEQAPEPSKRLRILYALDSYRPNIDGVGISIERQASRLAARGHEVMLLAPAQRFADYAEDSEGLDVVRVRAIRLFSDRWRMAFMAGGTVEKALEAFRPDVVVVSLPFRLNSAVLKEARRRGIPAVGITGTMPEWLLANLPVLKPLKGLLYPTLWRYFAAYYNQCDAVVGVTDTAIEFLRTHGLKRPSTVVSNGVELRSFYPRPRDQELARKYGLPDKPTVLYTGRLDAEKRMDVLVEAIPLVLSEVDAHFIIGGDGSEREKLEETIAKQGLQDHVTFTGFLETDEYQRIYSLANVFAIASPAELQSIVTLEAAASGLPIVGVNAGALPELVKHNRNGYVFALNDSAEMASNLVKLLKDAELSRIMGEESRAIARLHDIEVAVARYEGIYGQVATGVYRLASSDRGRRSLRGRAQVTWLRAPVEQCDSSTLVSCPAHVEHVDRQR
jgi:1,2-diacylglycerol 3-alpha-glucosyltransferase